MTTYVIDANDPQSEAVWLAYKEAQRAVRSQVGVAYRGVSVALRMYAELAAKLNVGGELEAVAAYHAARSAGLLVQEQELVGHLQAAMRIIEAMQASRPDEELFPGVPKDSGPAQASAAAFAVMG